MKKKITKKIANRLNSLKKLILSKAKIKVGTSADNIKLGNMGSWAMLAGNCSWYIPELDMNVPGTCGQYCKGCFNSTDPRKSDCYVFKSYMKYTKRNEDGTIGNILTNKCSVKLGHAYRTIAMLFFRDDLFVSLDNQLKRMKRKPETVRINEAGELTCYEDLEFWCRLAANHKGIKFYLYTKNYDAVRRAIFNNIISENIFINISVWHKSGLNDYLEMETHPQIRAFVLVDEKWNADKYAKHGLVIDNYCMAYDAKGKMNHNVTCDKCKKCYSHRNKACGCFKH